MPDPASARPVDAAASAAFRHRTDELGQIGSSLLEGALYQYAITPDGQRLLTHLGPGAGKIFGELPPQLPVDIAWLGQRIHPEDEPAIALAGQRSHEEFTAFQHEVRIRAHDGAERWISIRSLPRRLPDGTVVWDGAIIDITERRRAELAVRRQAAFLAALNATTLDLLGRRSVTDVLHALADRAATLLRSPHAEISLLEGDELVVRAFSSGREYLAGDRVRRHESAISWRAIDTGAPVVVDDYGHDPLARRVYVDNGIRAAAVFPIVRDGQCVGVLGAGRTAAHQPFTTEDIAEGVLLARMAALVLHNAAIHEEAVAAAELRTQALRESEERFRAVFERTPIFIALLSFPDGRIVEVNSATTVAFGYSREEAIGRTTVDLGIWVDLAERDRYLARLRTEKTVNGFEATMRRRNGEIFVGRHGGTLTTINGRPFTLISLEDVTAQRQFEAARDRSLALTRATLESTADAILVVNAEGHLETYNRNFAEMWSVPVAFSPGPEAEAAVLRAILPQLDSPELFLASVRDVYSGSEDEVLDLLTCHDGRIVERFSRPQLLADRPVGRVWSFRDITDQRRAESALRQSEERFRLISSVSPVGIFSSDPSGRTVFVNDRWCELAGMTAPQAMGEGWIQALHPEDRDQVARNWTEAVRNGESSAAEFRFVRPDGSFSWLVGQCRAQHHADGTLAGYVGTITDVTHLKRAEEARKHYETRQRQSRKMESLGTLAGGIAHDFNNILTGVFGFIDLARHDLPAGHPVHEWLDRIAGSSQRARDLVRQILTFSRKSEGSRIPQRLHLIVGEALRLLRTTLPPMVQLEAQISAQCPPVRADATQIHQVVINLCTNAWHALPPQEGRIVVRLEPWTVTADQAAQHPDLRAGPYVRLAVADNGSGMDAATLEQIFEPFFTTKRVGSGTGLGLSVVHGVVKSHEGAIVVHSAPGAGSTFELYFPASPAEPATPHALPSEIPRGRGQRVMVVDDDPVSGFALEKLTEVSGYSVKRHQRPEDALAEFAADPAHYDLILSDLAMPGMNGAELAERMMRLRADLPVIIVTGYVESARQQMLEKSSARAVLHKPVSRDELARAIAQHIRP